MSTHINKNGIKISVRPEMQRKTPTFDKGLNRHLRRRVFKRDGYKCVYCNSDHNLTLDHTVPLCMGGLTDIGNLSTCCRKCNQAKADSLWYPGKGAPPWLSPT